VGGDEEQMTSRIDCTFVVDGRSYPSCVDIKQTVGADYATGPLEVSAPADYPGPIDLEAVREEMTAYYRRAVHVVPGFQGKVRMRNNRFISPYAFSFEADTPADSW
jgi:hypothetical protein